MLKMIEHTFWKAMPCVLDWIRENRLAEILQFRTIISEAIENNGFQFTSMEDALLLYKKAISPSLDYSLIFWEENYYDAHMLMRSIKEYIFDKVKCKVMSEMKKKIGIVESMDSIESIKKLEWDVLEEYLTELLEFTPYSNNTNHSDTLHCRCLGHEVNIESETINTIETIEIIDIEDFHNHFNERTEEYEWCGFQMTYNADIFFRTLATIAEIKRREILKKKFK